MVATGTLLASPTATITFDGLMLFIHDPASRLCRVGIHTQAEQHKLDITVVEVGDRETTLWPKKKEDWDGSHEKVRAIAPLWLYVDSGNGRQPEEFSAGLHQPEDTRFSQSFGHVLDFEGQALYGRRLSYVPEAYSLLNVANGEFYTHEHVLTELKKFGQNQSHEEAEFLQNLVVCSVAGADIDAKSQKAGEGGGEPVERHIVLEQENPKKELFRFKLEEGKHYFISLVNGPPMGDPHAGHAGHGAGHAPAMSHSEHFLQFYELFTLNPDEKKFLVELPKTGNNAPSAPPCNVGRGGSSSSFS